MICVAIAQGINILKQSELALASVRWDEHDTPVSEHFDDAYYSRGDGQAESRYVFIEGNGLPQRWQGRPAFTIAELGFGTGLNFLETMAAWQATPEDLRPELRYVSFELYPLERAELERALRPWDDLEPLASELCALWPPTPGWSAHGVLGVQLDIGVGDAASLLPTWDGSADAWYLDGFSPAKNPDMWEAELMRSVFQHTAPGGTFATFTAAGWVRRNLQAAGFDVGKMSGYGRKRECLQGIRNAAPEPS